MSRAGACLAVLLVPASMACRDASRASTAARIDTQPSGIIHISNPLPEAGAPDFELIEDLRIGRVDGEGPDVFGEIWDLEVDSRGRIHVLDVSANEVRVFDAEGRHLWTAGREGRGPGELSYPVGLALDEQERVWVVDAGNGRYSVFEDGELVEERVRHVVAGVVPWKGGFDATGRLWDSYGLFGLAEGDLVGMVALDEQLLPTDSLLAGRVEEEVFETPIGRGATRAHVPFTPWIAWNFDPRGYLFVGDAAAYVIRQLSLTGDTIRIIRRAMSEKSSTGMRFTSEGTLPPGVIISSGSPSSARASLVSVVGLRLRRGGAMVLFRPAPPRRAGTRPDRRAPERAPRTSVGPAGGNERRTPCPIRGRFSSPS